MILSSREYLSLLPPGQVLSLRYEDVLQHPREKLRDLIAFIDPSLVDDAWLDSAARIPRPNPSKFSLLDAETQRAAHRRLRAGAGGVGVPSIGRPREKGTWSKLPRCWFCLPAAAVRP